MHSHEFLLVAWPLSEIKKEVNFEKNWLVFRLFSVAEMANFHLSRILFIILWNSSWWRGMRILSVSKIPGSLVIHWGNLLNCRFKGSMPSAPEKYYWKSTENQDIRRNSICCLFFILFIILPLWFDLRDGYVRLTRLGWAQRKSSDLQVN